MIPTSVQELLQCAYRESGPFDERLTSIKALHTDIPWYPFRTLEKMRLLQMVSDHFDTMDSISFLSDKPAVLDVGAADGDLAFLFESVGCEVTAVDNHHSNNNRCVGINSMKGFLQSSLDIRDTDIDYDFSIERQYDLIIFLDILYHLRNPLGAFINLSRLGRYMVLSTRIFEQAPNGENAAHVPCAYLLAPFESAANDPTNYWMFTEIGLLRALERGGWRMLKQKYFGYEGSDSSPSDPTKDKRVICLCERMAGFERLKYGHVIA